MKPPLDALLTSQNEAMREVLAHAARVAKRPAMAVRIQGEAGTGKEVLARFIHDRTHHPAQDRPSSAATTFVRVSLAGSAEELLRSELFGHEGAAPGALEHAAGGTLFLEDLDALPVQLQLELLGALKTHRFRRLGGSDEHPFEARVIVTTGGDIAGAVRKGTFRPELLHRLDAFRLLVPPLRERREDILPLACHFLDRVARQWVRPVPHLSAEAEAALAAQSFPGNVRELRNIIESALIRELGSTIGLAALDLKAARSEQRNGVFFVVELDNQRPPPLAEVERRYLERVLEHALGNKSEAARVLAVSYPTVARKIAEYGIKIPGTDGGEPAGDE